MNLYKRKLYALLRTITEDPQSITSICQHLDIFNSDIQELSQWWDTEGYKAAKISSSSDKINFENAVKNDAHTIEIRHPISGQQKEIVKNFKEISVDAIVEQIQIVCQRLSQEPHTDEAEKITKLYWWCWRFYPELLASLNVDFLNPAHLILPDCSHHSYNSTVAALTGAMFPKNWQPNEPATHPYLLIFTFSPVQEFIKASRKFIDFWSGSYLLHYLSAILCWEVAQKYGPDAVITPSLWSQEIIDALLLQLYPDFKADFQKYQKTDPISKFENQDNLSQSLSTAGFPNVITVLVPGKDEAMQLGQELKNTLNQHWQEMAYKVRDDVKNTVREKIADEDALKDVWKEIKEEFKDGESEEIYLAELRKLRQAGCWEWNSLWLAQIQHTWESYFVAVPLGNPDTTLETNTNPELTKEFLEWIKAQNEIADIPTIQPDDDQENLQSPLMIPTKAELNAYNIVNVGTWWGSFQGRLGKAIQAIKNTRSWQIPVASGERSTLSGQYTALHPRFLYQNFYNGLGLPLESLRLFWKAMSVVYPGVFNGSEKLNSIELTKRMAWKYGGVAENLGINLEVVEDNLKKESSSELNKDNNIVFADKAIKSLNYEALIRFPNLCSIASANFAAHNPEIIQQFWSHLRRKISEDSQLKSKHHDFCSLTRRPFQVRRADAALKSLSNYGNGFNGVMFSSKWLGDDLTLTETQTSALRVIIDDLQKEYFGNNSPADWWVLVLGDGDGMGQYVSGRKLKNYADYIVEDLVDNENKQDSNWQELLNTKKRMGPATHVGLNRALLDFSNRLVPYITEQRYCGKVIYSGGDDVMAALPLADLPGFLLSLRAAWCGADDPEDKFTSEGGYWQWLGDNKPEEIPHRPLFTMGKAATMSLGIVIAHKSVPLPTVLESIWDAEKERAKKLSGVTVKSPLWQIYLFCITVESGSYGLMKYVSSKLGCSPIFPPKDGLCFRVIYGSGNTLEALMKGHLLPQWWSFLSEYKDIDFSPVLYRLAEALPRHAEVTKDSRLFSKAAQVILASRDEQLSEDLEAALLNWLDAWEEWAWLVQEGVTEQDDQPLGTKPEDLANLLRLTAFLVSRRQQELNWGK
ncbi:type III-B CRISPR-associated protein Cas10/Cmr2 [Nodularia sp. LEGE 04288]|uniref:type III-B CRISPR-associated protein Cas10/Cmr2 n=1 Tax=Nodularia sp. LEGE 04288 TaxID=1828639 RepID=UPI001D1146BB|nr:type III-B CRISPR-associated protein Cas10/Cmr2 [Nodularia sp. LEGE 04288]MCC2694870.1 type III-B CRISPR-associated protein Cas10/Cmr2 [Nodularia sp. LEGE 04288]